MKQEDYYPLMYRHSSRRWCQKTSQRTNLRNKHVRYYSTGVYQKNGQKYCAGGCVTHLNYMTMTPVLMQTRCIFYTGNIYRTIEHHPYILRNHQSPNRVSLVWYSYNPSSQGYHCLDQNGACPTYRCGRRRGSQTVCGIWKINRGCMQTVIAPSGTLGRTTREFTGRVRYCDGFKSNIPCCLHLLMKYT
jgi:hypothetical protein